MPSASIIISCHNCGAFVAETIESALAQTRPAEVVVVDDGSIDSSARVLASFGSRIVVVTQEWSGQAVAINSGIEAASGDLLYLLDSDDLAAPDRVETIAALFAGDRSLRWARHSLSAIDDDGNEIVPNLYSFEATPEELLGNVVAEGKTSGTTSGLVVTRRFMDQLGPIPAHYRTYADSYLLLRGALVGGGTSHAGPLGAHRWHGGSYTAYHWRQFERAEPHLLLRKHLAQDAAAMASSLGGPPILATGTTWWQEKARAEWLKYDRGPGLLAAYGALARALWRSDAALPRRILSAGRAGALAALPHSLFRRAWWLSHVGRPSLLGSSTRHKLTRT